jgi:hypothetical protein
VRAVMIEVTPDDGGPVDAEHIEIIVGAAIAPAGTSTLREEALTRIRAKLRECTRPASARLVDN